MKIGIDIDNTIAQTIEGLIEYFAKKGREINKEDLRYEGSWILNDEVYTREEAEIAWWHDNDWLGELELQPGAKAIFSLLGEHELHLITARPKHRESIYEQTLRWLELHNFQADSLINSKDKALTCKELEIDVMIEDNPKEVLPILDAGIPVLLFDQVYNRDLKHPLLTRFTHWAEVPKLLERVTNTVS